MSRHCWLIPAALTAVICSTALAREATEVFGNWVIFVETSVVEQKTRYQAVAPGKSRDDLLILTCDSKSMPLMITLESSVWGDQAKRNIPIRFRAAQQPVASTVLARGDFDRVALFSVLDNRGFDQFLNSLRAETGIAIGMPGGDALFETHGFRAAEARLRSLCK